MNRRFSDLRFLVTCQCRIYSKKNQFSANLLWMSKNCYFQAEGDTGRFDAGVMYWRVLYWIQCKYRHTCWEALEPCPKEILYSLSQVSDFCFWDSCNEVQIVLSCDRRLEKIKNLNAWVHVWAWSGKDLPSLSSVVKSRLCVCLCLCAHSRGQYNTHTNNKLAKGSENSLKHVLKEILPLPLPAPLPLSLCLHLPKLALTMTESPKSFTAKKHTRTCSSPQHSASALSVLPI